MGGPVVLGGGTPFLWAAGDVLNWEVVYEAA
jgi:hypothetical protein